MPTCYREVGDKGGKEDKPPNHTKVYTQNSPHTWPS